ncbi:hypothetical protein [Actinomadura sp. CNU-125]|uniref:hypothetical protein n=1 Tax=Actinomadura sp. CNU-125 TaxID=1904961 RepID=UPI0011777F8D|nr:hypothetical protein [Actinomadura sp. CNU-125]
MNTFTGSTLRSAGARTYGRQLPGVGVYEASCQGPWPWPWPPGDAAAGTAAAPVTATAAAMAAKARERWCLGW